MFEDLGFGYDLDIVRFRCWVENAKFDENFVSFLLEVVFENVIGTTSSTALWSEIGGAKELKFNY